MKIKIAFSLLTILAMLLLWAYAFDVVCQNEIPYPFDKIKEILFKTAPDEQGNHFLAYMRYENGKQIILFMIYLKQYSLIGIGTKIGEDMLSLVYLETTKELKFIKNGQAYEIKDKEKAIEWAIKLFKIMVGNNNG